MPFSLSSRNDILYLSLDTPGSSVNIFNRKTAQQLLEIMDTVTPTKTRAIVFESAKPGSFINGVGLLLSHAALTPESLLSTADLPRRAYIAVRNSPVPTIATIRGTCWGCGMEFILNCDYRLAANTYDTHFYMTEINDYLFITFFGAAQRLPQTVGLEQAVNLLLWGERWSAQKAVKQRLINEAVADECFETQRDQFVERVLRGEVESAFPRERRFPWGPREETVVATANSRIASLPPAYHKVYSECLDLLVRGAKNDHVSQQDLLLEAQKSAESAACELGKSAFSFFYIRQVAEEVCLRGTKEHPSRYCLSFYGKDPQFVSFQHDLSARILREVTVDADIQESSPPGSCSLHFIPYQHDEARGEDRESISVTLRLSPGAVRQTPYVLYNPLYAAGSRFFELAIEENGAGKLQSIVRYLLRAGFQVALSSPKETFSLNLLLFAYLHPLLLYCLTGGTPQTVNFTLRQFGFIRRPHDLLSWLDHAGLSALLSSRNGSTWSATELSAACQQLQQPNFAEGEYDENLIDACCLSLLAATQQCLTERRFHHPSLVDLAAREVLDFPLQHRSLCSYLTKERVKSMWERRKQWEHLLPAADIEQIESFLTTRKRFYL